MLVCKTSKEKYIDLIKYVFYCNKCSDWKSIMQAAFDDPYEVWAGCAEVGLCFYKNEWGYAYVTISGRYLLYFPGRQLFVALNMDNSAYLKSDIERIFSKELKYVNDKDNDIINPDEIQFIFVDRIPEGSSCFMADRFYVNTFDVKKAERKLEFLKALVDALENNKPLPDIPNIEDIEQ